ncbi:DUF298-domain-containing protein [Schizophyllum commune Loenen D]|nr:DUF298-domain-containing protein [Schizophyllum commune Loenen D]
MLAAWLMTPRPSLIRRPTSGECPAPTLTLLSCGSRSRAAVLASSHLTSPLQATTRTRTRARAAARPRCAAASSFRAICTPVLTRLAFKAPKSVKHEPYTPARAKALFNSYEDADEKDVIGAEGFMRLCEDAGIEMEGAHPLILAWHLQCKEMAKISREEWMKGLESLQTGTLPQLGIALKDLETLLVHGETSKETPANGKVQPYNKAVYQSYAADPQKSFRSLYNYCYTLIKPPQSKNIDMETACAMWSVLLAPKYPHMKKIVDFTTERIQTHRAANKDLWQMMLEFCETVSPNLDNYEADGAWPTLLDEFVEHEKGQQGNEQEA